MKASEIRKAFLEFFQQRDHSIIKSSSVIPHDDPTLLFTNAGMVQFKRCFLGEDRRPYTRATTSQKCMRAGGKHNDLENVGRTARPRRRRWRGREAVREKRALERQFVRTDAMRPPAAAMVESQIEALRVVTERKNA